MPAPGQALAVEVPHDNALSATCIGAFAHPLAAGLQRHGQDIAVLAGLRHGRALCVNVHDSVAYADIPDLRLRSSHGNE